MMVLQAVLHRLGGGLLAGRGDRVLQLLEDLGLRLDQPLERFLRILHEAQLGDLCRRLPANRADLLHEVPGVFEVRHGELGQLLTEALVLEPGNASGRERILQRRAVLTAKSLVELLDQRLYVHPFFFVSHGSLLAGGLTPY